MIVRAGVERGARRYESEQRRYAANREAVRVYAKWLGQIPWQLFCTFTFAWKVSDQEADEVFREFVNRLERRLKNNVCYARGDEKRFSGCGKPACGRHYHVLLASTTSMDPGSVACLWMSMAGQRSDKAGALVEPFNRMQNGIHYVLKLINQIDGDWAFRNLDLFLPVEHSLPRPARARRRRRRHANRTQPATAATVVAPDSQRTSGSISAIQLQNLSHKEEHLHE